MRKLALIFVCVACLCTTSGSAYLITVDANAEECFFDRVDVGTKLRLTYQIVEGGLLDIDVLITGPDNKIVYRVYRRPSGESTFTAHMSGVYRYCFSNKMLFTVASKLVMFNMVIEASPKVDVDQVWSTGADDQSNKKVQDMFHDLSGMLTDVQREQEYTHVYERIHKAINETTNSLMLKCSLFEALILAAMTCGQVYYLKRLFEVRREV